MGSGIEGREGGLVFGYNLFELALVVLGDSVKAALGKIMIGNQAKGWLMAFRLLVDGETSAIVV